MVWKKVPRFPTDEFYARRGKWRDQVHDDPGIKGDGFRVMYGLERCLDSKSADPFTTKVGDVYIAAKSRVHVNSVRRWLLEAARRGHLSIIAASGRRPRTITLVLDGQPLTNKTCESGEPLTHKMTHKANRGSPLESMGRAPISQDSHKYKKEEDSKSGLPRGASPPEKPARYIPFDSPHWETLARWERKLPPARRPIRDRRGGCWLSETDYKAVNGGGTTGVSS